MFADEHHATNSKDGDDVSKPFCFFFRVNSKNMSYSKSGDDDDDILKLHFIDFFIYHFY